MLKSYEVWYWGYDPDNLGQTQMLRKDVLVSDAMLKRCMSRTKYDYYVFIIDDGQKWIVASNLVMQLRERVE